MPHCVFDVPPLQTPLAQQPFGHVVESHGGTTHAWFVQTSEEPVQSWQALPAWPHWVLAVPPTHMLFAQHPLGHVDALHGTAHAFAKQISLNEVQSRHALADAPHSVSSVPAAHALFWQQPLGHVANEQLGPPELAVAVAVAVVVVEVVLDVVDALAVDEAPLPEVALDVAAPPLLAVELEALDCPLPDAVVAPDVDAPLPLATLFPPALLDAPSPLAALDAPLVAPPPFPPLGSSALPCAHAAKVATARTKPPSHRTAR